MDINSQVNIFGQPQEASRVGGSVEMQNNIFGGSNQSVTQAKAKIGSQDDNGMCERFAEKIAYGRSGIFPSASDAWNTYAQSGQAKAGLEGAKAGDLLYFSPDQSNGGFGHVGVYNGRGKIISATYNGVEESDLNEWVKSTGQRVLGHVPMRGGAN